MNSKGILSLRRLIVNGNVEVKASQSGNYASFNAYTQDSKGTYAYFNVLVYNQSLIERITQKMQLTTGSCIRVMGDVRPFSDFMGQDGKKQYIGTVVASDIDFDPSKSASSLITLIGAKLGKAYQSQDAVVYKQAQNGNRFCTFGVSISSGFGDNRQYINFNCMVFRQDLIDRIVQMKLKPGSTIQLLGHVDSAANRLIVLDLDFDSLGQKPQGQQPAPQQAYPQNGAQQYAPQQPAPTAPVQSQFAPQPQQFAPQPMPVSQAMPQPAPQVMPQAVPQQPAPQQQFFGQNTGFGQPQPAQQIQTPFGGIPTGPIEEFS